MYGQKKCMKCGKPATHKFTRIENGQVYDIFLCADHAAEMSPYQKPPKIPLSDILEGLLKQEQGGPSTGWGQEAVPDLRCDNCGLTFEHYKRNLMLGCSTCYTAFHDYLVTDLRKLHGDTRHFGRRPGGGHNRPLERPESPSSSLDLPKIETVSEEPHPHRRIEQLEHKMKTAIEQENYKLAAHCRDQIRELRANIKPQSTSED